MLSPSSGRKEKSMKRKTLAAVLCTLLVILALGGTAWAENSITATVPVTLTVSNEYRAINVTVPAAFPVHISNGTVIVADNAKITNNSKYGAVQVTGLSVTDGAYHVGDYNDFTGSKTIALKINGCPTVCSGYMVLNPTAFPVIRAQESLPLKYYAKVSGDAQNAENVQAANVVFTISVVD